MVAAFAKEPAILENVEAEARRTGWNLQVADEFRANVTTRMSEDSWFPTLILVVNIGSDPFLKTGKVFSLGN